MASRSSKASRMPAASPASTRLQYRLSKYIGNLRNAAESEVPVSTSVRMSLSNLVTLGFGLPRPTISKACSSGTPAFIMVASWRVKMARSLGRTRLPARDLRFLILLASTPWRRNDACTWFSPTARVSPRTCLPLRSLPSHSKTNSLMFLLVAVAIGLCGVPVLFVRHGEHFLQRGQACFDLVQAGLPQRAHAFALGLFPDLQGTAIAQDDALNFLADRHDLVDPDATLVAVVAGRASDRFVGRPGSVDLVLPETRLDQCGVRDVDGGLAADAQPACQSLGGDQNDAGRNVERRNAHVAHARERGRRVIGVQRGQHQVARLRRL